MEDIKLKTQETPLLEGNTIQTEPPSKTKFRLLPTAVTFGGALLIAVSLTIHAVLIMSAVDICKNDADRMLISMVLPSIEKTDTDRTKNNNTDKEKEITEEKNKEKSSVSPYINCDLSAAEENAMSLMNETAYEPDLASLIKKQKPIMPLEEIRLKYGEDAPVVIIYHTHGSEAYIECKNSGFRSTNTTQNVVAVGKALSDFLEEKGIHTIHLEEMFDVEDFNTAYDRSCAAVRKILASYPSIRYIIDVHRDSIEKDGEYIKCAATVNEKSAAQLMLVCGTDEGGSDHTKWQDNLTVALQLQATLWSKSPQLMRPIDLKSASFYQDSGAGATIVEFGSCANSLNEAKCSAEIFAEGLFEYINR